MQWIPLQNMFVLFARMVLYRIVGSVKEDLKYVLAFEDDGSSMGLMRIMLCSKPGNDLNSFSNSFD